MYVPINLSFTTGHMKENTEILSKKISACIGLFANNRNPDYD